MTLEEQSMAPGQQVTYQVTRVTPDTQFPPGEQPVKGQLVAYTTSSGYSGSVFIPDSVLADQAAVKRVIEAQIMLIGQAQAISGTVQVS